MVDKTTKLLRQFKRTSKELRTPIATEMYLPNLSGAKRHPEISNEFVTIATAQTVTGKKTFTGGVDHKNESPVRFESTGLTFLTLASPDLDANFTLEWPFVTANDRLVAVGVQNTFTIANNRFTGGTNLVPSVVVNSTATANSAIIQEWEIDTVKEGTCGFFPATAVFGFFGVTEIFFGTGLSSFILVVESGNTISYTSLGHVFTGTVRMVTNLDMDGTALILDADADTQFQAFVDDTLELTIAAALDIQWTPKQMAFNNPTTVTFINYGTAGQIIFGVGATAQVKMTNGTFEPVTDNDIDLGTSALGFKDIYSTGARVQGTTRVTTTYTVLVSDRTVFANTDSGAYTTTLPAGVEGQTFRIINSGSSTNNLTVSPDGTEHLYGANSNFTLLDAESIDITYNATDGWY